jgi:hypothetical protein
MPPPLAEPQLYLCLTASEITRLLALLGRSRGPRGYTPDEAEALLDWANQARWAENTLRQVLSKEVGVDVREGQPYFIAPGEDDASEKVHP